MTSASARAEQALRDLLRPQLTDIVNILSNEQHPDFLGVVELPVADTVDYTIEEMQALVARSANTYQRAARLAGMARAEYKLAKGAYERKYKQQRVGRNDAEREKNAMQACSEEQQILTIAEAIVELATGTEHAARIASESTRKILGSIEAQRQGLVRDGINF